MTKFGAHLPSSWGDSRAFGDLCRRVEEWGFDSIWLADGLTRNAIEPMPALAYASAFTHRVRLGTCIYVVPVRHPLVTAKLTSAVDRISGGRFILGVGVGWREDEFRGTGVSFEHRGKVTDECLQIITQAWATGRVDFKGTFFQISDAKMEFQPAQQPRPEIWIGGDGPKAIRRTTRFGDCWIPTDYTVGEYEKAIPQLREACRKFGKDPNQVRVASHFMTIIDTKTSEADAAARNVAESLHTTAEELREWALVGDSAQVIKRIENYNALGVSYHVLNFGTKVRDEARIELFAKEVLPSFT